MVKTPKERPKTQRERFIEAARESGASEDPLEFERTLRGLANAPPPETVQDRKNVKGKKPAK